MIFKTRAAEGLSRDGTRLKNHSNLAPSSPTPLQSSPLLLLGNKQVKNVSSLLNSAPGLSPASC